MDTEFVRSSMAAHMSAIRLTRSRRRWRGLRPLPAADSAGVIKLMPIQVRFPAMPAIARIRFGRGSLRQIFRCRWSLRINRPDGLALALSTHAAHIDRPQKWNFICRVGGHDRGRYRRSLRRSGPTRRSGFGRCGLRRHATRSVRRRNLRLPLCVPGDLRAVCLSSSERWVIRAVLLKRCAHPHMGLCISAIADAFLSVPC